MVENDHSFINRPDVHATCLKLDVRLVDGTERGFQPPVDPRPVDLEPHRA